MESLTRVEIHHNLVGELRMVDQETPLTEGYSNHELAEMGFEAYQEAVRDEYKKAYATCETQMAVYELEGSPLITGSIVVHNDRACVQSFAQAVENIDTDRIGSDYAVFQRCQRGLSEVKGLMVNYYERNNDVRLQDVNRRSKEILEELPSREPASPEVTSR